MAHGTSRIPLFTNVDSPEVSLKIFAPQQFSIGSVAAL
jgi:hypothetical protein